MKYISYYFHTDIFIFPKPYKGISNLSIKQEWAFFVGHSLKNTTLPPKKKRKEEKKLSCAAG